MSKITKISVISTKNIGYQILKDTLTTVEKKILIAMLNAQLKEGQVRNKVFYINKTSNNNADVMVGTITKSIILGKNELIKQKVKIKFS
jgi:hypothetical protein